MKKLAIPFVLLVVANTVLADAISQNSKVITHQIQIDNLKDHSGYVFFLRAGYALKKATAVEVSAVPTEAPKGGAKVRSDMRLFAVPKDLYERARGKAQDEWFDEEKTPTVLQSGERVPSIISVKKTDPTARIVTHLEVTVKDGKLSAKKVADKRYDSNDREVPPPDKNGPETTLQERSWFYLGIPVLAAGLLGFTLYIRRKKPA